MQRFNCDELYDMQAKSPTNLLLGIERPHGEIASRLDELRALLTNELNRSGSGQPYGEFLPGGNTQPCGHFFQLVIAGVLNRDRKTTTTPLASSRAHA